MWNSSAYRTAATATDSDGIGATSKSCNRISGECRLSTRKFRQFGQAGGFQPAKYVLRSAQATKAGGSRRLVPGGFLPHDSQARGNSNRLAETMVFRARVRIHGALIR